MEDYKNMFNIMKDKRSDQNQKKNKILLEKSRHLKNSQIEFLEIKKMVIEVKNPLDKLNVNSR